MNNVVVRRSFRKLLKGLVGNIKSRELFRTLGSSKWTSLCRNAVRCRAEKILIWTLLYRSYLSLFVFVDSDDRE